jgi:2-dehydropantoate 2-reductase
MDDWQKSHLALVIPLANGLYLDGGTNYTTARNKEALRHMSLSLKENFRTLKRRGITITPWKYCLILLAPQRLLEFGLRKLYATRFAEDMIYSHAIKARNEMMLLENDFDSALKK